MLVLQSYKSLLVTVTDVMTEITSRLHIDLGATSRGRCLSPGLTSSEQQARMQSLSEPNTRVSITVPALVTATRTLTLALWCCLEKHVSGSTADTGSDVSIIMTAAAEASRRRVCEVRPASGRNMAAAGGLSDREPLGVHGTSEIHTNLLQQKTQETVQFNFLFETNHKDSCFIMKL